MKGNRLWLVLVGLFLVSCSAVAVEQSARSEGRDLQQTRQPAATVGASLTPIRRPPMDPRQNRARDVAQPVTATPLSSSLATEVDAVEQLLVNIYRQVSPAVVHVEVTGPETAFGPSRDSMQDDHDGAASGSDAVDPLAPCHLHLSSPTH